MNLLNKLFKLQEHETDIKTEIFAGLTTFFTMSYLFILSPKLLEIAGMNFSSSITVTAIMIFIGCILMAFIANKPYAVAPFLGETAFISLTLCASLGFSIKSAFSAIFISGIILLLMTLFKIRMYIVEQIPKAIKASFCVGLGLFFVFISLKDIGIVSFTQGNIPLASGNFTSLPVILGLFTFIILIVLIKKRIKAAVILSIFITTILGILFKDVQLPNAIVSLPSGIESSFCQFDFKSLINKNFIPLIFIIFLLINIDTAGAIVSLEYKTKENKNDNKNNQNRTMIADSIAVILAPILGTTTPGAYIDSMTGIAEGGKTGLTSITVGILFLIGLIFTPIIEIIPSYAYAPALLYVGILMTTVIKELDFNDIAEYAPSIITIAIMIFTYNIGIGIISGFITYPLINVLAGQKNKINITTIVMFILSLIFLMLYPY